MRLCLATLIILAVIVSAPAYAAEGALVRQYGLGKVTLSGNDFGDGTGRALLGGFPMRIEAWTPTEIVTRVPDSIAAGRHQLVVKNADGDIVMQESFFVKPNVWSIDAQEIDGSTYIELTGSNFGAANGKLGIEIADAEFAVAEWINDRILLRIGEAVPAGWYRVTLRVDGRRFETGQVGIAPRADRLLSDQGAYVIEGAHFDRDVTVMVGDDQAELIAASSKKVWFSPISATPGGRHAVRIVSKRLSSETVYLEMEPRIAALRFASGHIVVLGTRFGEEADGGLYMNGQPMPIYAWDSTSVTVGFPRSLTPGEHAIVAKIGGVDSSPHFLRLYPQKPGRVIDGKWETPDFEETW